MHILINASYQPLTQEKVTDFEACYSVSSKSGKVPRFTEIKLTYFDEQGKKHESIEKGFYARALQHEIDHINGVLIINRLTPDCVQGSIKEMMILRRQELSPEQREIFDAYLHKKDIELHPR